MLKYTNIGVLIILASYGLIANSSPQEHGVGCSILVDGGTLCEKANISSARLKTGLISLDTCNADTEGYVEADNTSGADSGSITRICICTSNGQASPSYVWVNMQTAKVGTTTTCKK